MAVILMRTGLSPQEAAESAIKIIKKKYPDFMGAIVAADAKGNIGVCLYPFNLVFLS
jgi:isoaspartyl peptidase/L-asparaginase-like protein (Ntn-hydrolase superfamily)